MGILDTAKIVLMRKKLGLTQEAAAQKAGFASRQNWNRVEKGLSGGITLDTLEKLATALECRPADLLVGDNQKPAKGKK